MSQTRVMYYLNQFFAGMGGEEKADLPVGFTEGAAGPGKRLQALLGDSAEIVVTAYCGDDYLPEHHDEALDQIAQIARDHNVEMAVAGPAFASGRYGFACAEVCHAVSNSLGLYCVTGMYPENPGVEGYRQSHDRKVYLFPTTQAVSGMDEALKKMAQCISQLATGATIGSAAEQGYLPRGLRDVEVVGKKGTARAIDMLLDKVAGRPFTTEIPLQDFGEVPVAPRITNLKDASLALINTMGIVPAGNPDSFKQYRTNQWKKYSIDGMNSMTDSQWDVFHIGVTSAWVVKNGNYGSPVDVCRQMEGEGVFARLYPYFYSTTGAQALISVMQGIGREMARDMKAEGVDFTLLTSA